MSHDVADFAHSCPVCRGQRWRQDDLGFMLCIECGHQSSEYREEEGEFDTLLQSGARRRREKRIKLTPAGGSEEDKKPPADASDARALVYEAMLRVLRLQVETLVSIGWADGTALRSVALEIWLAHVRVVETSITEPPSDARSSLWRTASGDLASFVGADLPEASQPPAPSDGAHDGIRVPRKLKLVHTLSVLLLSCAYLRLPVLVSDIRRLIFAGRLPFLEASALVPDALRRRLDADALQKFSPAKVPSVRQLSRSVHKLRRAIETSGALTWPPADTLALLARSVRVLKLPGELFACAARLQETAHIRSGEIPADALTGAAIVVAFKLLFGADDAPRTVARRCEFAREILPDAFEGWRQQYETAAFEVPWGAAQLERLERQHVPAYAAYCRDVIFAQPSKDQKGADADMSGVGGVLAKLGRLQTPEERRAAAVASAETAAETPAAVEARSGGREAPPERVMNPRHTAAKYVVYDEHGGDVLLDELHAQYEYLLKTVGERTQLNPFYVMANAHGSGWTGRSRPPRGRQKDGGAFARRRARHADQYEGGVRGKLVRAAVAACAIGGVAHAADPTHRKLVRCLL